MARPAQTSNICSFLSYFQNENTPLPSGGPLPCPFMAQLAVSSLLRQGKPELPFSAFSLLSFSVVQSETQAS